MKFLFCALTLIAVLATTVAASSASQVNPAVPVGLRWSPQERVPDYDDDAATPYLVADQNRTVHAFNSLRIENDVAIVYSQWNLAQGWSPPIDILLSPEKRQARIQGAMMDNSDLMHVIFFGGDDLGASIYYSKAYTSEASRSSAWSQPWLIGEHAGTPTLAGLIGDGSDHLYVIYSGKRDGVGMYGVRSSDGGITWTEPATIYLTRSDTLWPSALDMDIDDQGNVHIVWTVVNIRGNGEVIYYSRFDAETKIWSEPVPMAVRTEGGYEVDWGSIVFYGGQLILVYQDSQPATRWMRRSSDGGQTWSDPVRPFSHVGEYRHAAFVIDSENYLHMLLGNRTTTNVHGMWHSVWLGDRWSELEPIISGSRVTSGPLARRFDPSAPRAVMIQGNTILVAWVTDPGAGRNGVWYSYTALNMPELPVAPLATRPVATEVVPTPTPVITTASDSPAVAPVAEMSDGPVPAIILSPSTALVAAVVPVMLLLLVVIVLSRPRL